MLRKNSPRIFMSGLVVIAAGIAGSAQDGRNEALTLKVLSSRPEFISGGDALVQVERRGPAANVKVTLNGLDVSGTFHPGSDPSSMVGLVEGLTVGRNVLEATAGTAVAKLELTNHSLTGPIMSGPHQTPYVCMTQESGLGVPQDADCSVATRVDYFYRGRGPGGGQFRALNPKNVPENVAMTTTRDGRVVPYIVRVESGTINRAIYRIAILDDPRVPASSSQWTPGVGWNGRVVFTYGGGCGTSYTQGRNTAESALSDLFLSRGFAHIVATANVLGQFCNDALSGETTMMLKEHFIERYGIPAWTVGSGGSGGADLQELIAQSFPGLLDGLMITRAFPDLITLWTSAADCQLLAEYFKRNPDSDTPSARRAIEGMAPGTCPSASPYMSSLVATHVPGCGIPSELVYDPVKNRRGARCTVWDTNVNSYGRDPSTGAAQRTYDNVGVQYGLAGLNSGAITKRQFLDVNTKVGGYDNDGNIVSERTGASPDGVRLAYSTGRVNTGGGSLGSIPIISFRAYLDDRVDIHDRIRDLIIRDRLQKANGRSDNYVSWLAPDGPLLDVEEELTLTTMGQWLDALRQDRSSDSQIEKVIRAKPRRAVDACWDHEATRIDEPFTMSPQSRCNQVFPLHSTTRLVAGSPLSSDVLKCQLKPPDRRDYRVTFTDDEWEQLKDIFPGGVCDYSKPGVNYGHVAGTYLTLPLRGPAQAGQNVERQ